MNGVTLIVPYYRNPLMLRRQLEEMNQYPSGLQVIIVDDGSPEPAEPIVKEMASAELRDRLRLYRILVDIPWNREQARNIGAREAVTDWIVQVDIDHILPVDCVPVLLAYPADDNHWYRFPRWRVGKADATRRKDRILPECEFGEILPHMDSYLVRRDVFWEAGGLDEDFAGVLGGGSEFLQRLEQVAREDLLPKHIHLHVYTRHAIADASDLHCDRDRQPGKVIMRRKTVKAKMRGKPSNLLRLPWERVL